MDTLDDIISMGCTLFDLAQNARINKGLCQQLASFVQAIGMNLTRVARLYTTLSIPDDEFQKCLCEFSRTLHSIHELVERTSKMGRLRRYITISLIEDDFREGHLSIHKAVVSIISFASFSDLEADRTSERQKQEISALNNALKNLLEKTAHPNLPQDTLEGDQQIAIEIEAAITQIFQGDLGQTEGRRKVLEELDKLYSTDDPEGDVQELLQILERDLDEASQKDPQTTFASSELFEMVQVTLLSPPEWCCCPLTCTVMRDPVIVSGSPCHPTVERRAIESYLAIERSVCPVSQKPLENRTLIPETKLMQAISWWKNATGWKNQTLSNKADSSPVDGEKQETKATLLRRVSSLSLSRTGSDWFSWLPGRQAMLDKQLSSACKDGKLDVAEKLVVKGADPQVRDLRNPNRYPLHLAAIGGHTEVVEMLLSQGADLDARDATNWTALTRAAAKGYLECAEVLLRAGADIEAKSSFWCQTPLMWAAESGHLQMVQLLVRYGASIKTTNKDGKTAIDLAQDHTAVKHFLTAKSTDE